MGAALNEAPIILGIKRGAAMSNLFTRRPGLREFGLNPPENPSDFCYKICHIYDYDDRESPILLEAKSIGGVWVSGWLALRSINSSLAAGVELHFKGRNEFRGTLFGDMGMVSGQVCCILPKKVALTRATELAIKDEISSHLIDRFSGMIGGISFKAYQAGLQALIESDPGGQFSRLLSDGSNPFAQAVIKAMRHHKFTTNAGRKTVDEMSIDGETLNIRAVVAHNPANFFLKERSTVDSRAFYERDLLMAVVEGRGGEIEYVDTVSSQSLKAIIKYDEQLSREELLLREWFSKAFRDPSPNKYVSVIIARPQRFRGFPATLVVSAGTDTNNPACNWIENATLLINPASDLMRAILDHQPTGKRAELISTVVHSYAAWFAKESVSDQYQSVRWNEVSELVAALVESRESEGQISKFNEEIKSCKDVESPTDVLHLNRVLHEKDAKLKKTESKLVKTKSKLRRKNEKLKASKAKAKIMRGMLGKPDEPE
jgi:FtsZ-binding cell division protein ZapB